LNEIAIRSFLFPLRVVDRGLQPHPRPQHIPTAIRITGKTGYRKARLQTGKNKIQRIRAYCSSAPHSAKRGKQPVNQGYFSSDRSPEKAAT